MENVYIVQILFPVTPIIIYSGITGYSYHTCGSVAMMWVPSRSAQYRLRTCKLLAHRVTCHTRKPDHLLMNRKLSEGTTLIYKSRPGSFLSYSRQVWPQLYTKIDQVLRIGGSLRFTGHRLQAHAQHGQRSKEWGPSDVNILNQWIETTYLLLSESLSLLHWMYSHGCTPKFMLHDV